MGVIRDDIVFFLDRRQGRRDACKAKLAEAGLMAVGFDNSAILVDNIVSIQPRAVLFGAIEPEELIRALHVLCCMADAPQVILLDDMDRVRPMVDSHVWGRLVVALEGWSWPMLIKLILRGRSDDGGLHGAALPVVVGRDGAIQRIRLLIHQLADSSDNICIFGEPGTGKELLARSLHLHSSRRHLAAIKIQCDQVVRTMSAIDLYFALTEPKSSWSLQGGVGMLFIENIQALPGDYQAQLLRAIEAISAKGDCPEFRIVSTTSLSPGSADSSIIRSDLYYRLNVIQVDVPPLRQRLEDVGLLLAYFADRECLLRGKGLNSDFVGAAKELSQFSWPGNIGEFKLAIERWVKSGWDASVLSGLTERRLVCDPTDFISDEGPSIKGAIRALGRQSLKEVCRPFAEMAERRLMAIALERARGNRKKAAEILNISYKSLLNKVKEYEMCKSVEGGCK